MPASVVAEDLQTPPLNTDRTLVTLPGPVGGGVYCLHVDAANLANGEAVTISLHTRARPSGTTRAIYEASYAHVQADPIKASPIVAVPEGSELVAVLRQTGGTPRGFPWALIRIDA